MPYLQQKQLIIIFLKKRCSSKSISKTKTIIQIHL